MAFRRLAAAVRIEGGGQHAFLRQALDGEIARDAAGIHDQHAIAHAEDLGQFRRHHDDGHAAIGQVEDHLVDVVLGADVHAARRFVQDQHLGVLQRHLGQYHFLLVAAGKAGHRQARAGGLDAQAGDFALDGRQLGVAVDPRGPGVVGQAGQRDVLGHAHQRHDAVALAILGHQAQAMRDRVGRAGDAHRLARHPYLGGAAAGIGAVDRRHEFGAARAHQSGDAEDLAGAHLQGGAVDALALRVGDVPAGHVARFQHDRARLALGARKARFERAADHQADDAVLVKRVGRAGSDVLAIADHRDGVADALDLVELVRDVDAGHAGALEVVDDGQQHLDFLGAERGCRLVENQQPGLFGQRLGDLEQLLVAVAVVHDGGGDVDVGELQARQQFGGAPVHGGVVHAAAGQPQFVAQEDVLGDAQLLHQHQLLVQDDDARAFAVADRARTQFAALPQDPAAVAAVGIDPGQHFHQGRLAGAVLAAKAQAFAGPHPQADARERAHAREFLDDVAHFKQRLLLVHGAPPGYLPAIWSAV